MNDPQYDLLIIFELEDRTKTNYNRDEIMSQAFEQFIVDKENEQTILWLARLMMSKLFLPFG